VSGIFVCKTCHRDAMVLLVVMLWCCWWWCYGVVGGDAMVLLAKTLRS